MPHRVHRRREGRRLRRGGGHRRVEVGELAQRRLAALLGLQPPLARHRRLHHERAVRQQRVDVRRVGEQPRVQRLHQLLNGRQR